MDRLGERLRGQDASECCDCFTAKRESHLRPKFSSIGFVEFFRDLPVIEIYLHDYISFLG